MAKKAPAIPLKDIMAALDKRDRKYYNNLTPELKKAFSSWMMMRYASSVQGKDAAHYIYMTNELVNRDYSEVSKHPELQWLLLSACGVGKVQFHPYLKPPNAKKKKDKVSEFIYSIFPHMKGEEVDLLKQINSKDELKEYARSHGYDDKTIKDIFGN